MSKLYRFNETTWINPLEVSSIYYQEGVKNYTIFVAMKNGDRYQSPNEVDDKVKAEKEINRLLNLLSRFSGTNV